MFATATLASQPTLAALAELFGTVMGCRDSVCGAAAANFCSAAVLLDVNTLPAALHSLHVACLDNISVGEKFGYRKFITVSKQFEHCRPAPSVRLEAPPLFTSAAAAAEARASSPSMATAFMARPAHSA